MSSAASDVYKRQELNYTPSSDTELNYSPSFHTKPNYSPSFPTKLNYSPLSPTKPNYCPSSHFKRNYSPSPPAILQCFTLIRSTLHRLTLTNLPRQSRVESNYSPSSHTEPNYSPSSHIEPTYSPSSTPVPVSLACGAIGTAVGEIGVSDWGPGGICEYRCVCNAPPCLRGRPPICCTHRLSLRCRAASTV